MIAVHRLATNLWGLLFPALCNACGNHLYGSEKVICTKCLYDLPYTDFHLDAQNLVAKQFWGRVSLHAAMALLHFKKGSKVQNLMHSLKYKGNTEVGENLGKLLGHKLQKSSFYDKIDLIIPVPLHPKKEKQRGYNQSECIANGLAEVLQTPVDINCLIRIKATDSQTKKGRYTRYENMEEVFSLIQPSAIADKHILLVDDVITTGATLEACANALLKNGASQISIAAIAFAN